MAESHVPDDFPPATEEAALSGAQPKVVLGRDLDGTLKLPGDTAAGRLERYRECMDIVDWALDKAAKPKYLGAPASMLLRMLQANLQTDFGLPSAEASWVLEQYRRRLAEAGRVDE